MAYNRLQAERLLSASELPLFLDSLADRIGAHGAAQLRALVKRARTQRDKARDLWQRQRVATRGRTGSKGGASGAANVRTELKARLFDEALRRFEKRLACLDAASARAAAAAGRKGRAAKAADATARTAGKGGKAVPATAAAGPRKVAAKVTVKAAVKAAAQRAPAPAAPTPPARSAKAPARPPSPGAPALGPTSEKARSVRNAQHYDMSGTQRVQGHISVSQRRNQAKRDGR